MSGLKLNKYNVWVIFTHLNLEVAVARHNFKWVTFEEFLVQFKLLPENVLERLQLNILAIRSVEYIIISCMLTHY